MWPPTGVCEIDLRTVTPSGSYEIETYSLWPRLVVVTQTDT